EVQLHVINSSVNFCCKMFLFLRDSNTKKMNRIENYDFTDERALIRVDFNVPLNDKFEVTDSTRIKAAIPTILTVLKGGGSVVLMSHLGRPKSGPEDKFSLKHIIPTLESELGVVVNFEEDCIGDKAKELTSKLTRG